MMASMKLGVFLTCILILLATFVSKIKSQGILLNWCSFKYVAFMCMPAINLAGSLNLPPTFFAPLAVFTPNEEQPAGWINSDCSLQHTEYKRYLFYVHRNSNWCCTGDGL